MKKLIIIIIISLTIFLPIAYYLISPIYNVVELDEEIPTGTNLAIKGSLETMDDATRKEFEEQMDAMKNKIMVMDDTIPVASVVAQGEFKENAHEVGGKALLVNTDNKRILRFEDFDTINGPDLRIYLSSDLGDDDFIELGKIKATKGNVNYEVADDVDTSKYKYVLVWCKPFKVLFSYAELI
jgi:hypothetical protein